MALTKVFAEAVATAGKNYRKASEQSSTSQVKNADTNAKFQARNYDESQQNQEKGAVKYQDRNGTTQKAFSKALTSAEWKKYNHAMATKLDAGLRINDHAMLVECEGGDYSYKLVIYDNTFEDNPIVAVYGINRGQDDISPDNFYENKVSKFLCALEDKQYDNEKVLGRILQSYSRNVGYIFGKYDSGRNRFYQYGRTVRKSTGNIQQTSSGTGVPGGNAQVGNVKYQLRDSDYSQAVAGGDMETAQRLVDEAANRAMPKSILREGNAISKGEEKEGTLIKMYHGSGAKGFNTFKVNDGALGKGIYLTSNWDEAVGYAMDKLGIEVNDDGHSYTWNGEDFDGLGSIGEALESEGYVRAFYANVTDQNDIATSSVYWEDVIALVRDGNQIKSADPVTYDDNGNVIPLSERFKTSNPDIRYSLREVEPVQPSSDKWKRTATTSEVMAKFPDLWNVAAEESETRNPTQITGTVRSYRKIYDFLKNEGFDGKILDASSGLGYGTRAGIEEYGFDVEDIEPYPDKNYHPKYKDYSKLHKKYDVIISNAVLNVIPQEQRDALVSKMGELLNEGGRMFINVRGKDVESASSKVAINEDLMEYYISSTGSYQKGFTKPELVAYLQDALGNGYDVKATNMFGAVSAVVTKKSDSGIRYQDRNGIDNSSGKWNNKKHKKGSIYNEFASIAMSWANETGRKPGDIKRFYSAKHGNVVEIEADGEGGFTVIYVYSEKEYEEIYAYERKDRLSGYSSGQGISERRGLQDNLYIGNQREYGRIPRPIDSSEQTGSDTSRNSDDSGRYSSFELNDAKLQERLSVEDRNRVEILENKVKRLEGELKKMEADAVLAGQMSQGKAMAKEMRHKAEAYEKAIAKKKEQISEVRARRDELLEKARTEKLNAKAAYRFMSEVASVFHVPKETAEEFVLPIIAEMVDKGPVISERDGLFEKVLETAYSHTEDYIVENASSKVAINEDLMEYYISSTGSYQKGFTKPELVAYLQDALGDGFTVEATNMFGAVSAVVTKDSGSGIRYSDRDYSYETIVNKPDMKVTIIDDVVPKNRADVIS